MKRAERAGRSRASLAAFIVLPLIVVATLAANTGTRAAKTTTIETSTSSTAQGQSSAPRIESERITLTYNGFVPNTIKRPQGRFLLAVNNRLGVSEVHFNLKREAGTSVLERQLPQGRRGWRQQVDLPPGRYTLTAAGHPTWSCQITISAK